jgi:hypothetical protein
MDEIIDRCSATIKRAQHGTVNNAREELTSVSRMGVVSAFREFSFGNNPMGIYGSLPFETLHAWLLGLMEYMLEGVFSHVVPPRKVALWCEKRYSSNVRVKMSHRPAEHNCTESMVKTDQAEFERRIKISKEIATIYSVGPCPCATYVVYLTVLAVTFFTRDNHGVMLCTSIRNSFIRRHKRSSNKQIHERGIH